MNSPRNIGLQRTKAGWKSGNKARDYVVGNLHKTLNFVHLIFRLVLEDDGPIVYFSMANSRVYQERDIQGMEIRQEVRFQTEQAISALKMRDSFSGSMYDIRKVKA